MSNTPRRRGRPSKGRTVARTLRMTPDVAAWLQDLAEASGPGGSVDAVIEEWVIEDMRRVAASSAPSADEGWQADVQTDVLARLAQ